LRYILAPDSFKESLTAFEAVAAMEAALRRADPDAVIDRCPLSDGGEGLIDVLRISIPGVLQCVDVEGPRGESIEAEWLLLNDGVTAVLESARCIGLTLLESDSRNPVFTSSHGLGRMIRAAVESGATVLTVGLGGTATNDAGCGMAAALGYSILPPIEPGIWNTINVLSGIRSISRPEQPMWTCLPHVVALTDVANPLLGPSGSTCTFARQKGARETELPRLEEAVRHFSDVVRRDIKDVDPELPGTGSAGGLGFGLAAFCNAELRSGIETVLELTNFRERCAQADVVITGEGRVDRQTMGGKLVSGVSAAARGIGKPVVAFAGRVEGDAGILALQLGLSKLVQITPEGMSLGCALRESAEKLEAAVYRWRLDEM
jgi:glycerate 2-kinase